LNSEFISFPVTGIARVKQQMLSWCSQFNICCFLDNHNYVSPHHSFECLAGAGAVHYVEASGKDALELLHQFILEYPGWKMGHLGYDLKNDIESLSSSNPDNTGFPDIFFFVPETILLLTGQELKIGGVPAAAAASLFEAITAIDIATVPAAPVKISLSSRFSREEYITTVNNIRRHILRGDCYEVNFCQEFFAEKADINPVAAYRLLEQISPNPFAVFYRIYDKYLCCASPERYIRREGNTILSQPIKGTSPRDAGNSIMDEQQRQRLLQSVKERSENVMVVDLVRNDLAKICIEGSVQVEELFGIYSFPQVHQMISTVRGCLHAGIYFRDIVKATFPMGSMTGAPKRRVMELVEQYEKTKRGIFSGAVGYIGPDDDFDFNVVIRSIMYNQTNRYLSCQVGSAITFYSDAEAEYEECLLKAMAIKKVME
jgi:para-aminobenzoate synthetase component 1